MAQAEEHPATLRSGDGARAAVVIEGMDPKPRVNGGWCTTADEDGHIASPWRYERWQPKLR
jgi:hypothetical protein